VIRAMEKGIIKERKPLADIIVRLIRWALNFDDFVISLRTVMPDLIRHPEPFEFAG
jgi:hypothetical protein